METPETWALVGSLGELERAEAILEARDEFVIKPDSGYGGKRAIVVTGCTENGDFETLRSRNGWTNQNIIYN
ncbi:hypothetical protein [Natronolimnohabitans innermongolicus]|uniref:Uncharacterized protein n=1 Tax=Natronolimnohabitans innermongolicus JCM 12255 TaxID=1227499 RepID=L9WTN0_9EURY|nr:hypothetical protein [Natronolimnohabitans innermongolicus]ELY52561.1 hypothetical protein C493_15970 [Natronolimnohabitans innermongolicus JCM 12255]